MSKHVRFCRLKTIPALKGLKNIGYYIMIFLVLGDSHGLPVIITKYICSHFNDIKIHAFK